MYPGNNISRFDKSGWKRLLMMVAGLLVLCRIEGSSPRDVAAQGQLPDGHPEFRPPPGDTLRVKDAERGPAGE